jgi:hypothetical protein
MQDTSLCIRFLAWCQKSRLSSICPVFEDHLVAWADGVTEVNQNDMCWLTCIWDFFAMKCTRESGSVVAELSSIKFCFLFSWNPHLSLLYVASAGKGEDGRRKAQSERLVERICNIGNGLLCRWVANDNYLLGSLLCQVVTFGTSCSISSKHLFTDEILISCSPLFMCHSFCCTVAEHGRLCEHDNQHRGKCETIAILMVIFFQCKHFFLNSNIK